MNLIQKDNFAIVLYKIILIYIVFDGLRDNLIISNYITFFKEGTTLLLFFYIVFIKKIIFIEKKYINIIFSIYLLFLFIFLPFIFISISTFNYLSHPLVMYYKILQFFLLIYIFSVYEIVTKDKYENILKFFIDLLVVFVIVTPIIYFTNPSFMVEHFKQWGRINIGYPTMDAENLILGLILMFFVFQESFIKSLLIISILLIGILMQNTATGYITLIFILGYYLVSKNKLNKKTFYVVTIIIFIFTTFIIYKFGDLLKDQLYLLQVKINSLLNPETSKSLSLRAQEFQEMKKYINSSFENLFGIGFKIYLENQYDYFRIGTGLLGFYAYILFLLNIIIYAFFIRRIDKNILFLSSIIFALTSYSLITLYLFPTEAAYAMMIGYSLHLQRRYKFAKINNRF